MIDATQERELGWDDEITAEMIEWVLLPAGEYEFEVTKFERARYEPGPLAKMPACPLAKLELTFNSDAGTKKLQHNLFLHSRT